MALEMVSNGTVPRETALAVDGQGIYFYYDRKKKSAILNGVNIAVPRGVIYSLLGPSGCGKTTLLKCITGQLKPQEGSLKTYGKTPGSKGFFIPGRGVGYMPQDLALFQDMTAEETLTFFGSLFHMSKLEICERITFLVTLLALPDKTRQIKHLSGGQQRRVSFAVALVHKPPLLILDEPTVGVDPVLRQNIWKHLVGLARNEKSTIIITTHYIEEARKAHVAGLMREGRLLVERNPEDLIRQYRVATLEQVFLTLCQNSQKANGDLKSLPSVESLNQNSSTQNSTVVWLKKEDIKPYANGAKENCPFEDDENKCSITLHGKCAGQDTTTALLPASSFSEEVDFVNSGFHESWRRFVCLTNKNFLCLRRNTSMMLFQMFLPTIPLLVFCLCVGGYPFDLPVAIVNMEQDTTAYSRTFLNTIDNRTIQQKEFGNLSSALQSVRNGDSWAAVYIGPEFSTCLVDRVLAGAEVINDTVECSDIRVYLDMSNQLVVITIYYGLLRSFLSFASDLLLKFGKNPLLASLPLKIEDTVYGTTNTSFTDFLAPGMILTITYIMAVSLTCLSVLLEKRHGLLQRTFVAGATVTEVLLSIFVAFLLTLVAQVVLMLSFAFLLFDIPCNGPFFWVAISVLLTGISGMAYGFFISAVCQDEYVAVMVVLGSFNPTLVMSGIIWSLEAMPHYLRYISYGLPLTLMARSLRCILIRGWNITDHHIWDGFLISIGWSILFMILSTMLFKIKK